MATFQVAFRMLESIVSHELQMTISHGVLEAYDFFGKAQTRMLNQ